MKIKNFSLVVLFVLLASLLSGCASGGALASSWPGVTLDNGMTYVAYTSYVYAINPDGTQAWIYPAEADRNKVFYASPAVVGDQVVVGDFKNILFGLDLDTGKEIWTFAGATDRYIGKPLAVAEKNLVVVPNADHNLYAIDNAGKLAWKYSTGDPVWAQPVTDGKTVFVASMDGFVYALSLADGAKIWSTDLGAAVVYSLALSADGMQLYAGTLGNKIVSVNAETGTIAWETPTAGGVWARVLQQDDILYFGDQSGKFTAISAKDGTQKWQIDAPSAVIGAAVLVGEDSIAFPTEDGEVVAVDFKGTKLWTQPVNGKLYSNLVYTGEKLVVAVTKGEENLLLVALNPNGTQSWTFNQP